MLFPELWNRCSQWIEATTSWRESRSQDLTHLYFAGHRSGDAQPGRRAINAHLSALDGKKRELGGLVDEVERAFAESALASTPKPDGYNADRTQREKDSVLSLLKQVENELEDQIQDWRGEMESLAIPQADSGVPVRPPLDSLRALLFRGSQTKNRRALSYNFRVPTLGLRRSRKGGSSKKRKVG